MEDKKKENIKYQVNAFVAKALNIAETQGKLDYFTLEITNHNGKLDMKHVFKDIKKVY